MRLLIILGFILLNFFDLSAQCSTIYFYRPDGVLANKTSLKLAQNGENVTTLRIGDRIKATACSAGKYRFEAYSDNMLTRGTFDVDISDGQDYYVKVLCPLGSFPSLKVMSISKGEKELRRASKFNGNIRTVRLGDPVSQSYTQTDGAKDGNSPSSTAAQPFIRDQTRNNFRFRVVEVLRAGKRLILNYEITNLGGQDRKIHLSNVATTFYDDKGNILKAKKSCIYSNCATGVPREEVPDARVRGHEYRYANTNATLPTGIPIKASIEIGDIRVGSQALLRGIIYVRESTPSTGKSEEISLSYGKIELPTDIDPNNPLIRKVGVQSVQLTSIERIDDRVRISGTWTNNDIDPFVLKFSKGNLYSNRGDTWEIERSGFGNKLLLDDKNIKYSGGRNTVLVTIDGGNTSSFTLYTKPSLTTATQFQRIDLDFLDYAFSWDDVEVTSDDNQLPAGTTAKAPITTDSAPTGTENYVTYDEFSRKASTPRQLTGKKIILENITFNTGSDQLSPSSSPQLRELANLLTRYPLLKVEVSGHTDNVGDEKSNFLLSQQRADAVRYYLIGEDIDPARVASIGRGQTMPIAANITALGRQANRRVELQVQE